MFGMTCRKANCISSYETKATSKEDAEFANTEKSAADAEQGQNITLATYSSQTQLATTYRKFCAKTLTTLKSSKFFSLLPF
jgi:hypothetical protein